MIRVLEFSTYNLRDLFFEYDINVKSLIGEEARIVIKGSDIYVFKIYGYDDTLGFKT